MTANASSSETMTITGASTNTARSAKGGIQSSLNNLDHVGDDLQQAERTDPVRPVAVLEEAQQAALEPGQAGGEPNQHDQDAEGVRDAAGQFTHGGRPRRQPHRSRWSTVPQAGKRLPIEPQSPATIPATPAGKAGRTLTGR